VCSESNVIGTSPLEKKTYDAAKTFVVPLCAVGKWTHTANWLGLTDVWSI